MYNLEIKESLDKKFKKIKKKDRGIIELIDRKVRDILDDPYRFKPLRKPLQNKRRVHVGGAFVLIYEINEEERVVTLLEFDHHDNIYKA
jgi:YafQ family addiction module toxin component